VTARLDDTTPLEFYRRARESVQATFGAELSWQATRELRHITESDLLRESAWVILCSGFREAIVRRYFPYLSICFCEWESAAAICHNATVCRETAMSCFKNIRKIDAIVKTAFLVHEVGFETFRDQIIHDPVSALRRLPYIGDVTGFHLAKNLGAEVAKPDRHLVRCAVSFGFEDVQVLCSMLAAETGDSVSVVDLVLWRYLEQQQAVDSAKPPNRM